MDICELCLIRAMSDRASGRTNEALDRLAYALELAEKYRYDRLIADECGRMHALLTLYKKERGSSEYLERVIKLAEETTTHHPKYLKEQSASHPPLTEAEKKVIRLLAAGYSNSEISDLLGIAVDTVKQHCRHIFAKLEVSSRTAAVAKAAELGIIDNISTTKK
jgi:LuxR family maltose regulon positive regulatory protein